MSKIGSFEYPDFQFKTLLEAIEILVKKFNGQISSPQTFASAIGHKSPKSGAYLRKIADLRKYGLIEKRNLTATNIGKRIVNPLRGEKEKKENLNYAIKNVSLWMNLYERLKTKSPNLEDFRLQLAEITKDEDDTRKSAEKIRNLYIEAMTHYSADVSAQISSNNGYIDNGPQIIGHPSKNMELISYKQIKIEYPKDDLASIDRAIELLKMAKEDIIPIAGAQPPKETTGHPIEKEKKKTKTTNDLDL